jgi:hypothetical protein
VAVKTYDLKWAEICRAVWAAGLMKDFSRSECFRIADRVKEEIRKGNVQKVERGRYRLIVRDDEESVEQAVPE